MKKALALLPYFASSSFGARLSRPEILTEVNSGHLPTLEVTSTHAVSKSLKDNVIEDSCESDMRLINDNDELVANLKNISDTFDEDFNATPFKYCDGGRTGSLVTMGCEVNYNDFSSEYIKSCYDLGGITYPVTLLMLCSSPTLDLEFKLTNVPSCLGRSCNLGSVYREILSILEATENSISTTDEDDLECNFFHTYDSLINAPQSIEPIKTGRTTSMIQTSAGSSANSKFATLMSILGGGALMMMYL